MSRALAPFLTSSPLRIRRDGYTLRATDVGNINNEFAVPAPFSIGPEISPTSSLASSTSSSSFYPGPTPTSITGCGMILSIPPTSTFGISLFPDCLFVCWRFGGGTGSGTNTVAQAGVTNINGASAVEMKG